MKKLAKALDNITITYPTVTSPKNQYPASSFSSASDRVSSFKGIGLEIVESRRADTRCQVQ